MMVILERDGTLIHDARHPHEGHELTADLLSQHAEAGDRMVRYAFDVPGLGSVALEIEGDAAGAAGHPPRRFMALLVNRR